MKMLRDNSGRLFLYSDTLLKMGSFEVVEVDQETRKVVPAEQVAEPDKPAKTSTASTATQTRKPRRPEVAAVSEVVKPSKPSTDDYNIADILADV
jgi:hypothetical protein